MKRIALFTLLALAISSSVLIGCGSKDATDDATPGAGKVKADASQPTTSTNPGGTAPAEAK